MPCTQAELNFNTPVGSPACSHPKGKFFNFLIFIQFLLQYELRELNAAFQVNVVQMNNFKLTALCLWMRGCAV